MQAEKGDRAMENLFTSRRPYTRLWVIARSLMTTIIAVGFIMMSAIADTYDTTVTNLSVTYDYGPPYSYPRDLIYWDLYGDWSPSSSYHLEERVSYKCWYYDGDGPPRLDEWEDDPFSTVSWTVPPVDLDRSGSYTGKITAMSHEPLGT